MGLVRKKRAFKEDESAIAPWIIIGVLLAATALGAYGIYSLSESGDTIYNVEEAGPLSAFGVDLGSDTLLLIIGAVVVLFLIMGRRGSN